jgi:hypothetical protein
MFALARNAKRRIAAEVVGLLTKGTFDIIIGVW